MILHETVKKLRVQVKNGGSLISRRTLFSRDSKSLFVLTDTDNTVLVYSLQTYGCTGKIQVPFTEAITNFALEPGSGDSITVCSNQGRVCTIQISTGNLLGERVLNLSPANWNPITSIDNFVYPGPEIFFFLASVQGHELPSLYSVERVGEFPNQLERLCLEISSGTHSIACGVNGKFVAAIQSHALYVRDCANRKFKKHIYGERKLTCVAVHPYQWMCATGDDTGRVILWGNPMESNVPAKSVFHWHTLAVRDLCFSIDGSQMLSGGGECTLVKWDVDQTENKRTIPRMGLPIRHISVSSKHSLVAASHADNSIKIVDGQNRIVGTIQNITQCYIPESEDDSLISSTSLGGSKVYQVGLALDPIRQALVMNGKPGQLQCYSYLEDKHLYDLDITQQNYITAERNKVIPFSEVNHISFSKNGNWLATAESRSDEGVCSEIKLKFWKFESSKQLYSLNTSIEWPHENGIKGLKIQPIDDKNPTIIAVTSGGDCRFKTWGVVHDSSIHGKTEWWNCENVGTYRNHPAGQAAFSRDGSILAVAFSHTVTLWTTDSHQLKGALSHQRLEADLKLIEFGCKLSSHLILCTTETCLLVWDVITFSLLWAIPLQVESLIVDPFSDMVAVFSVKNHAYFFRPSEPEPLAVYKNVSKSKVVSSIFVPADYPGRVGIKSTLLFINASQELCGFLPKELALNDSTEDQPLLSIKHTGDGKPLPLTPFAQMMAVTTVSKVPKESKKLKVKTDLLGLVGAKIIRDVIDASPHTMPSISFYCEQLLNATTPKTSSSERFLEMEKLVLKSHAKRKQRKPSLDDEGNENMDVDVVTADEVIEESKSSGHLADLKEPDDLSKIALEDFSWISNIIFS